MMNLRDSQILNHKQNLEWNWVLISTILKVRFLMKFFILLFFKMHNYVTAKN